MPLRDRLKKTFGSKKSGSGDSIPSGTSPPRRKDIEYYKPHEIPKSKYRGKVDKAHQEKLEAYSFADAFQQVRRKTSQTLSGTFSPGGTNARSLAPSAAPSAAPSRRASWMSRTKSSLSTTTTMGSDVDSVDYRRKSVASVGVPREGRLVENEKDDTDPTNIGLSRIATAADRPANLARQNVPELRIEKTITLGRPPSPQNNTPFSAEDLEKAMTQATLRPRRGTVVAPAMQPDQVAIEA